MGILCCTDTDFIFPISTDANHQFNIDHAHVKQC